MRHDAQATPEDSEKTKTNDFIMSQMGIFSTFSGNKSSLGFDLAFA